LHDVRRYHGTNRTGIDEGLRDVRAHAGLFDFLSTEQGFVHGIGQNHLNPDLAHNFLYTLRIG